MDIKKLMRYGAGCLLMLFGAASCSTDDLGGTPDTSFPTEDGLYVSLRVDDKAPVTVTTRSEGVEEWGENTVSRVDLFLFEGDGKLVKHVSVTDGNMTQVCLLSGSDWHDKLTAESYTLYALANYREETKLTTVNTLEDLRELTQTDDILTPQAGETFFLMDGKVDFTRESLGTDPVVVLEEPIRLRRAAAKVEVTLTITDEAGFTPTDLTARVVNYATCTAAIDSGYPPEDRGLKSMKDYDDSVVCQPFTDGNEAKLRFYTYVNDWTGSMQNETMLLVNIPYEKDGEPMNNYYKVPLLPATTTSQALERNTHYQITATVNIKGNSKPEEPTPLKNAQCEMAEWTEDKVSVGDSDNPTYLILSEYLIDIRNTNGYDSLKFYSSSPITVELKLTEEEMKEAAEAVGFTYPGEGDLSPVFFVNAFDQRKEPKDKDKVTATPNSGTAITGNIHIESPNPENLTIRYITLKVTNGNGLTRYVIVKQYPLTYITGVQGLYSYVEKNKDGNLITGKWPDKNLNSIKGQQIPNEIINGFTDKGVAGLDGHIGGGSNQKVDMKSKFYMADIIYEPDEGEEIPEGAPKKGVIYRIDWSYKKDDEDKVVDYVYTNGSARNNRMYNVNITATSGDYIISRPEMDGEVVNKDIEENNNYVSPSFMLASQLGNASTMSWEEAQKNCQNYVEVSMDGHVYDDWRMPTMAELKIIATYQNEARDVMYQVLETQEDNTPYYWTAIENIAFSTNELTGGNYTGDRRIRCVRDVKPGENVNN